MSIDAYPGLANAQPLDATLSALAFLTTSADTVAYFTGIDTAALMTVTPYARTLLDDTTQAAMRTTLGLGTMAQQDAASVAITGGGATLNGLSVVSPATARWSANIDGIRVADFATSPSNQPLAYIGAVTDGTNRYNCYMEGTAPNYFQGKVTVGSPSAMADAKVSLIFDKSAIHGIAIQQAVSDVAGNSSIVFKNSAAAVVGYIIATATTTSYSTTSDARLKHAVTPLTGALDVVRRLRPITHLWNADGSRGYNFLAHELQQVIPDAVSGEPDAVHEDGSIKPQQVDQSRLVPWLTAAVKELSEQVQALTARVTSLEQQLGV